MKREILRIIGFIIVLLIILASLFVTDKSEVEQYINIYDLETNKTENYLFFGDSKTKYYPVDEFFEDLPVVNSGTNKMSLKTMKKNTHDLVSIYNPTHIIIEAGMDELQKQEKSEVEVYDEMVELIKKIKKEKPKATIYLESLYPTRDKELNKKIKRINKQLKIYSKNNDINYINIYPHLLEEDLLKEEYIKNDTELTDGAYARISIHIRAALKNDKVLDHNNVYNININPDEKIVFVGDSLTDLYPINDFFENINIINNGVCGFTTTDILDNMKEHIYDEKPTKVFINIGINDMSDTNKTKEEIFNNIKKIIKEIKKNSPKTKIYILSIYPMNTSNDPKIKRSSVEARSMEEINYINKQIKEKYENSDVTYIDAYTKLLDNKKMLKLSYTVDGIHLTNSGYTKLSEILLPYIAE